MTRRQRRRRRQGACALVAPPASVARPALTRLLAAAPQVPVLLDGAYPGWNEEYLDAQALAAGG